MARLLLKYWHGAAGSGATGSKREDEMSKMSRMGQSVVATFAAILLTATAVGAAVGPAEAAVQAAAVSLV
jgi:hypothetical protein